MSDSSFSVGVVGAGSIAANIHIPVLRSMPECEIAWILDAHVGRARSLAAANGLPATRAPADLADAPPCDIVLLALPLPPRAMYFDALQATPTAVLAEKPLATLASEHRALAETFEPWRLAVGFQRRRYAANVFLRQAISTGLFGPLLEVRVNEGARSTRTGGFGGYMDASVADGGGITKNLGCHSLDLLIWMTGAQGYEVADRRIEWDGDTDRRADASIKLKSATGFSGYDIVVRWTVSWLDSQSNVMEFRFERARLRAPIGPSDRLTLIDSEGARLAELQTKGTAGAVTVPQACYLQWDELLSAMRVKQEPSHSAKATLLGAELMDELLEK
jgi:predicted dehydrogenase